MAARHLSVLALVACLFLAGCPSSPPLAQDEIPGDFEFSYELKVTDEEAFQKALDAEEMEKAKAAAGERVQEPEAEGTTGEGDVTEGDATEGDATEGDAEPVDDGPRAGTEGLPVTYAYILVTNPGRVEYEIHFGLRNPVKRKGNIDLAEPAFRKLYRHVREADLFSLKKRHIGDLPTGIQETFVVKGNFRLQVIDIKGASVPVVESMWESVKAILLDKEARIFDNPKERLNIFIIDRRTKEFHRSDCTKLNEISAEFRIRKNTKEECLNDEAYPCETCRPLEDR